jgi:beta-glucosidase
LRRSSRRCGQRPTSKNLKFNPAFFQKKNSNRPNIQTVKGKNMNNQNHFVNQSSFQGDRPFSSAAAAPVAQRRLALQAMLASAGALSLGMPAISAAANALAPSASFPKDFLWGAATSSYQTEGNNTNSDIWVLEHATPTLYAEKSGDACNSFEMWEQDLDLVKAIGLNTYRFSLEWARIEPEQGHYSKAMLAHYRRMLAGCRSRNLTPILTFSHFSSPRWFAMAGGWTNPKAINYFAKFCEVAAKALAHDIGYAVTLNEPDIERVLHWQNLPAEVEVTRQKMAASAARLAGSNRFVASTGASVADVRAMLPIMLAAHQAGKSAIKTVRPDLPVGLSLSMSDDQSVGANSRRDEKRADVYGAWLQLARADDFIGVQNYDRTQLDSQGEMKPPAGAKLNDMGSEIWPASLGATVRYAHEATGVPVLITENGIATADDRQRADYIPQALAGLKQVIDDGVPVLGYVHWSLLDNFEYIFGYRAHFGLATVDPETFERTPKPSAIVLGNIAKRNAL